MGSNHGGRKSRDKLPLMEDRKNFEHVCGTMLRPAEGIISHDKTTYSTFYVTLSL